MKFDEIGYWSEIKLDIVKDYGAAYSKILDKQRGLEHVYIDAFAGAGKHISRTTGEFVLGSPLNALAIEPRFSEYHFVDLDAEKLDWMMTTRSCTSATATMCWSTGCFRPSDTKTTGGHCVSSTPTA
jgi:three-Cys-motif partner protein